VAWDERQGRVSRAFDEWKITERDQRTFLRLGLQFLAASYTRLWDEAGAEPYDEDSGKEQIDSFEEKVDGLHEHDFAWMHAAGVLKDAVTIFEVYVEKAREEVLAVHGHPLEIPGKSPHWSELKKFFRQLDVEIETEEVARVRDLRHFLTHRRGELRTDEQRDRYAKDSEERWAIYVPLTEEQVLAVMDELAATVRTIDPAVYRHSWGREVVKSLLHQS
jgi:hypothetical protein